jgi:hypothetical protein
MKLANKIRRQRMTDSQTIPTKTWQQVTSESCTCGKCKKCRLRLFVCRVLSVDETKCPNGYLSGGAK